MKNKVQRQLTIRKIISEVSIHSQDELLHILKSEGYNLTQATLSRDLRLLKVAKIPDPDKGYKYIIPGIQGVSESKVDMRVNFLADGFKGIEFSGNIGIIKTLPGYASSIASVIDSAEPLEILGTIAGDDTIMIVLREGASRSDIINSLILIMPNLEKELR
ncbi:MAG: ArgR family transcriptional regulator [Prolixibacteraceae bacterium]|nr:ArgR family transcriptional regulator [Prolixibacteraceae bacterium]MBN2772737.1 ArgR family transcriptional regulator [Prolixibacteraceae bacterium]